MVRKAKIITITTNDGYNHRGRFYEPNGDPTRIALIMSHSHAGDWSRGTSKDLRERIVENLPENIPLLFMDARNHGLNRRGDEAVILPTFTERVADIKQFIDYMKREYPKHRIYLGGRSKGAVESLLSAGGIWDKEGKLIMQADPRIDGLLLFSPSPLDLSAHVDRIVEGEGNTIEEGPNRENAVAFYRKKDDGTRIKHLMPRRYSDEYDEIGKEGVGRSIESLPEKIRVFGLHGTKDDPDAKEICDRLKAVLGERADIKTVNGADHYFREHTHRMEAAEHAVRWLSENLRE